MSSPDSALPTLIFGYGNPGRGDDALGPALIDAIEAAALPHVHCQSDMQLQIEHVTDLAECSEVIFVDADLACDAPFIFESIDAARDESYTSHAMSPEALLYTYRKVYDNTPPEAWLLRIRAYETELGASLTPTAAENLQQAVAFIRNRSN